MIVTVTLNAALDVTYEVPRLEPYASHRVTGVWRRGGGKGVNVARLLAALGEPVVATGLIGGPTGDEVSADLTRAGVRACFHPVAGESRRCVTVVADGDATVFNEPGPVVSAAEWRGFLGTFGRILTDVGGAASAGGGTGGDAGSSSGPGAGSGSGAGVGAETPGRTAAGVVVLSGSLPGGVPGSAYADLAAAAAAAGLRVVLDADGAALRAGLAGRPDVVKPNLAELARALGAAQGGHGGDGEAPELLRAAAALRAEGAGAVVASRGPAGAVAVTAEGIWTARPPVAVSGNPTGAGDAAVAALARALLRATPWPEALADAVALSAAAVCAPVAGAADLTAYRSWRRRIRVDRLSAGENVS